MRVKIEGGPAGMHCKITNEDGEELPQVFKKAVVTLDPNKIIEVELFPITERFEVGRLSIIGQLSDGTVQRLIELGRYLETERNVQKNP